MIRTRWILTPRVAVVMLLWLGGFCWLFAMEARSQTLREKEEITSLLVIENLKAQDGAVSGTLRNKTTHAVRDVQLLVRHTWLWDNEFKPGNVDPGSSRYETVKQSIPAGGTAEFAIPPSRLLPKTAGGTFQTTVSIAGYTEVIPVR